MADSTADDDAGDSTEPEKDVVTVRMERSLIQDIEEMAESEGTSKSDFIRTAVRHELGEKMLEDRVDVLEDAVEELIEEVAPDAHLERANSLLIDQLNEIRGQDR